MVESTYVSDHPIRRGDEDRLDRQPFAERLAKTLVERQDLSSLVVGIYGPWGDGKTSVLHMMEEVLQLYLLFIHPLAHGSEVSPAARNTLDSARIPRASMLMICGLFLKGRVLAQDGVREKEDDEPPLCEPCDGYGFGTECPTCEGQGELKREAQEPKPVGSLEHVSSIIPDLLKHLNDDK